MRTGARQIPSVMPNARSMSIDGAESEEDAHELSFYALRYGRGHTYTGPLDDKNAPQIPKTGEILLHVWCPAAQIQ